MPDKTLNCGDCGQAFDWTEREQDFYEKKLFDPPKRCKPCREARKKRFAEKNAKTTAMNDAKKGGRRDRSRQPTHSGNRR